jgi:hypothetical protein
MPFGFRFSRPNRAGNFVPRRGPVSVIIGILFISLIASLMLYRYTPMSSACSVPGQKTPFGSKPNCPIVHAQATTDSQPITSKQGDPNFPLVAQGIRLNYLAVTPQGGSWYRKDLTVSITNTNKSGKWFGVNLVFFDSTGKKENSSLNWAPVKLGAGQTQVRVFRKNWTPEGEFSYAFQVKFAY